jgi:RNA polymerase sigma-70 factor (ECF subfamily)
VELSEQLVAGDVDAFRTVVERFHAPVGRLAFRLLGWSGDVDDVVQDVFTAAWQGREGFARGSSVATWLMGITVNQCRMRQRWWVRYRRHLAAVWHRPGPLNAAAAEKAVFDQELFERVRAAVGSLPVRDREVVVLRYLQELPLDDVAKVLALPVNTVEVRLHRARKRLRPLLNGLLEE